jgi:hypothetical protein
MIKLLNSNTFSVNNIYLITSYFDTIANYRLLIYKDEFFIAWYDRGHCKYNKGEVKNMYGYSYSEAGIRELIRDYVSVYDGYSVYQINEDEVDPFLIPFMIQELAK